ncbi:unnamed protein product, partial [Polarella glacialis]
VAYINPAGFQSSEVGGQLRCHVGAAAGDLTGGTAKVKQDFLPQGGTAVLFPSKAVLHEVLPSYARRYALTLWFLAPATSGPQQGGATSGPTQ